MCSILLSSNANNKINSPNIYNDALFTISVFSKESLCDNLSKPLIESNIDSLSDVDSFLSVLQRLLFNFKVILLN